MFDILPQISTDRAVFQLHYWRGQNREAKRSGLLPETVDRSHLKTVDSCVILTCFDRDRILLARNIIVRDARDLNKTWTAVDRKTRVARCAVIFARSISVRRRRSARCCLDPLAAVQDKYGSAHNNDTAMIASFRRVNRRALVLITYYSRYGRLVIL